MELMISHACGVHGTSGWCTSRGVEKEHVWRGHGSSLPSPHTFPVHLFHLGVHLSFILPIYSKLVSANKHFPDFYKPL